MKKLIFILFFLGSLAGCATYEARPDQGSLSGRTIAVVVKYSDEIPVQLSGGPFSSEVRRTIDAKSLAIAEALLSDIERRLESNGFDVRPGIANVSDDQLRDGAHIGNVRIDRIGRRKEQVRILSSSLAADLILVVTPQPPVGNNFFIKGLAVHQLDAFGLLRTDAYAAFDFNVSDGKTGNEISWTYQTVSTPLSRRLDEDFINSPTNVLSLLSSEAWIGLALSVVPEGLRSIGLSSSHVAPRMEMVRAAAL